MDRLEKALKKARELRDAALAAPVDDAVTPGTAATTAQTAPMAAATPHTPPKTSSKQVVVGDDELEQNRIVARRSRDGNADIFRILRTKVLQMMTQSNLKTIAVTSANYGDGKTTIAVNLALSLALDVKQTVLLVDLDLRSPDVHRYLGIEPKVGLSDYFLRDFPVPDCLVKPAFDRLVVLPISEPLENSSEVLGTPKMATLAKELKTRYSDRIVIYDMPPLLAQDDTIAFLPHVDGVILVVRDGVTVIDDVKHCMNALTNTNLLGTVLNNCAEQTVNRI